jgi:hypothetical protein
VDDEQTVETDEETDVDKVLFVKLTRLGAEVQAGSVALKTIHLNVFNPNCKPVTPVILHVVQTGTPLPVIADHCPTYPAGGTTAVTVAADEHTV